jgi:MinD-like ATPase involved in chromosome partitioning or flagellar assembly
MIARRIFVISRSPALGRAIEASLGPEYDVVTSSNVTDVVEEVRDLGPFDVLVAGPLFDSNAGMTRLAQLRNEGMLPVTVLALGPKPKASLSDIVRTGAVELVEYTTSKRQLSSALRRAFDIAQHSHAATDSVMPVVQTHTQRESMVAERQQLAEVFTVASSSGGCGKTFYATNLACYLAAQTDKRVCLVDLDLQFGEISTALHLRPKFTIADLLAQESDDADDLEHHIEEFLEAHELGFSVLAAPFSPIEADMIAPKDIQRVLEALRRRFDYVVVDTPAQLSEVVLAAFDQSTKVLCMVTLDLPSIRNIRVFLSTLDKLRINGDAIGVVLNKVEDDVGIKISDVQEVLENRIMSILPYSSEVSRSINKGTPALVSAANSDIGQKLATGMRGLIVPEGDDDGATGGEEPTKSVVKRLMRRHRPAPEPELANGLPR